MIFCSLLFLCLLLFFPEAALQGSKYGALLWLNELLPTLLPFFIALRLFRLCLPKAASHPAFLLTGILCGYPTGASLVANQYQRGLLNRRQAYFYLGFVNNPSPLFIIAFCGITILHMTVSSSFIFFGCLLFAGLIGSLIFRCLMSLLPDKKNTPEKLCPQCPDSSGGSENNKISFSRQLDAIILESFLLVTKIGGYVILFSILGQFLCLFLSPSNISGILCLGSMEITSGISYLRISFLSCGVKRILTAVLLAFGGLSAAAQTSSVLSQSGLSIFPYVLNKCINAALAGLLCYFLLDLL